jgi:hypothetical protein
VRAYPGVVCGACLAVRVARASIDVDAKVPGVVSRLVVGPQGDGVITGAGKGRSLVGVELTVGDKHIQAVIGHLPAGVPVAAGTVQHDGSTLGRDRSCPGEGQDGQAHNGDRDRTLHL